MTFPRRVIDSTEQTGVVAEPVHDPRPRYPSGRQRAARDIHLLRLSLDLQLDAMLLTLGAAAAEEVGGPLTGAASARGGAGIPWKRWLAEDLELTRSLTATAISVDAALPPTLGATKGRQEPESVAGDLLARYESICTLLSDLIRDLPPDGTSVWRASISHALTRCRSRLDELRLEREAVQFPRRPAAGEEHRFLHGGKTG